MNLSTGRYGTMKWIANDETYTGEWRGGVPHGKGTFKWGQVAALRAMATQDGPRTTQYIGYNTYIGSFSHGKRHGYGLFSYANGAIYVGEWVENCKHGRGSFSQHNGEFVSGTFAMDKYETPIGGGVGASHNIGVAAVDGTRLVLDIDHLFSGLDSLKIEEEKQSIERILLKNNGKILMFESLLQLPLVCFLLFLFLFLFLFFLSLSSLSFLSSLSSSHSPQLLTLFPLADLFSLRQPPTLLIM